MNHIKNILFLYKLCIAAIDINSIVFINQQDQCIPVTEIYDIVGETDAGVCM